MGQCASPTHKYYNSVYYSMDLPVKLNVKANDKKAFFSIVLHI